MKKILSILLLAIGLVSCDDVEKDNPVNPVDPVTPDVEYEITDIVITGSGITAEGTVTLSVGTTLELDVEITPAAKEIIVREGYDPVYGARPLKRYLQSKVETLLARTIIAEDVAPDTVLTVDASQGELAVTQRRS